MAKNENLRCPGLCLDGYVIPLNNLSDKQQAQFKRLAEVVRRIEALQKELTILEEARIALGKSLKQERPNKYSQNEKG